MSDYRLHQRPSLPGHPLLPSPRPSMVSMGQSNRTSSQESVSDGIRKRVCKACDRCRLKKSKCDGASPCSRCKADNTICEFGERKKSQDKIYPKGYVEMLEQQQGQIVAALQEMYRRAKQKSVWDAKPLDEGNDGNPLTHDILVALNIVSPSHTEKFEEDTERMQANLLANGAELARRRSSLSSASDHSLHDRVRVPSLQKLQVQPRPVVIKQEPNVPSAASSPFVQSPVQTSTRAQDSKATSRNTYSFREPMSASSPGDFTPGWPGYDSDYHPMLGVETISQGFNIPDFDAGPTESYTWTGQPQWQNFNGPLSMASGYGDEVQVNQWSGEGNYVSMEDMFAYPQQQHGASG